MNPNLTFEALTESFSETNNQSIFVFEHLKYFDCTVNGRSLVACIYGHEMLLQNFGFWVSFSDGSHFLICTDGLSATWVTLIPDSNIYADAIQDKLDEFFSNNYDKLSVICMA
ncbi:hypothetical protein BH10BAC2_BH10BAC2_16680 [soil metagenome]